MLGSLLPPMNESVVQQKKVAEMRISQGRGGEGMNQKKIISLYNYSIPSPFRWCPRQSRIRIKVHTHPRPTRTRVCFVSTRPIRTSQAHIAPIPRHAVVLVVQWDERARVRTPHPPARVWVKSLSFEPRTSRTPHRIRRTRDESHRSTPPPRDPHPHQHTHHSDHRNSPDDPTDNGRRIGRSTFRTASTAT